jgi:BirA family biotin operon repressor/biotin-[acetyl-CoA-carboxylase] ligase
VKINGMDILTILAEKEHSSGEDMAARLGISRAAVHKRIQKLREKGYCIRGEKNSGYSLVSRPDLLLPEELRRYLDKTNLIKKIIYNTEIPSTQITAKEHAGEPDSDGTLVIAERQTMPYGRMRRQWFASEGGIWFSLVLKPALLPDRIPHMTFVMSLALTRAINRICSLPAKIKWPNDITIHGKKCVGILTEISAEVGRLNWVVIGVGVNVNNLLPEALREDAVSLSSLTGSSVNRTELCAAILEEFGLIYSRFCAEGFALFEKEYNAQSALVGKKITIDTGQETYHGTVEKIDTDGYLWLNPGDGPVRKIMVGTVILDH